MVACKRPLLGLALACIGLLGSIISCALPTWRITRAFKDHEVLISIVEGLWKRCAILPTGEMQCMGYEYIPLPEDMKAARALIIIAIIIEVLGILLGVAGRNFMNFVPDERQRSKMALTSLQASFFSYQSAGPPTPSMIIFILPSLLMVLIMGYLKRWSWEPRSTLAGSPQHFCSWEEASSAAPLSAKMELT
ncbi:unnamed protein product, partial [Oreochromis niloticus]